MPTPTNNTSQTYSFPRAEIKLNGKSLGWAQGISIEVRFDAIPQKAIGSMIPYDIPYMDMNINGSITIAKIIEAGVPHSLASQGVAPAELDTAGLLKSQLFDLNLMDTIAPGLVGTLEGVRFTGFSMQITRGQPVLKQVTFMAAKYVFGNL